MKAPGGGAVSYQRGTPVGPLQRQVAVEKCTGGARPGQGSLCKVTPVRDFTQGCINVIRREAWSYYRTISGVRLCWVLEEPQGPKGPIPRGRDASHTGPPSILNTGYLAHTESCPPQDHRRG